MAERRTRGVEDAPLSDVAYAVHDVLSARWTNVHLWIAIAHLGTLHGQLAERGLSTSAAGAIVLDIARAWAAGQDLVRIDGALGDPEVLAITEHKYEGRDLVDIMAPDIGGIFDLGVQYGQRRERRQSVAQAQYETGAWVQRWYTAENPWPPPPTPTADLSRLRPEQNRRYLRNDTGRFEWREVSGFSLLARMLRGQAESHVRPFLKWWRGTGGTVVRNILTLDGDYWKHARGESFRSAPDMPGYMNELSNLSRMHAEEGLYMRACYIGALEPWGGVWDPIARRDVFTGSVRAGAEAFVIEAATLLAGDSHVINEIANERQQIGMRDSREAMTRLGFRIKGVAPDTLLCASEGIEGEFLVEPFDYADAHFSRDLDIGGFLWIKRVSEYLVWSQDLERFPPGHELAGQKVKRMPFVMGEPPNWGESSAVGNRGDIERNPSACFGAAAMLRSRKGGGICFHYDGGLWTTLPRPETETHVRAFHDALNAFPQLESSMWRGQWGLASGDYWRDTWPGTDDIRVVERHILDGRGPWRAFGCGDYSVVFPQPKGWDWQGNLDAPAERLAFCGDGLFDCAVYRRT